jgi:hypothetical protein
VRVVDGDAADVRFDDESMRWLRGWIEEALAEARH